MKIRIFNREICVCALLATNSVMRKEQRRNEGKMTVDERIFLCRLLEKIEEQEAYCEMVGVRDRSTFQGEAVSQGKRIRQYERGKK